VDPGAVVPPLGVDHPYPVRPDQDVIDVARGIRQGPIGHDGVVHVAHGRPARRAFPGCRYAGLSRGAGGPVPPGASAGAG